MLYTFIKKINKEYIDIIRQMGNKQQYCKEYRGTG